MWKDRDSLLYKLLIYIDTKLLSYSDKIVILTYKMKDWLMIHRPVTEDKISVIPSCVDLSRFNFRNNGTIKAELGFEKKFLFVYTGSLGTWYLLSDMIDFFIIAKERIPNAHFLILTMNKEIAENIIKAKKVKLSDFTIKHVPFKDVPKFLQCSETAVCFIKPVLSKFASSPTKLAEFLASGIPVVMNSGIGDSDEILERERVGVVINNFNIHDYRRSIDDLLSLLDEKEDLKKRCVESAKKYFSLNDGVAKYSKIYQALL
jgi:glycosyltransferase involved in cell wall biosynthesis